MISEIDVASALGDELRALNVRVRELAPRPRPGESLSSLAGVTQRSVHFKSGEDLRSKIQALAGSIAACGNGVTFHALFTPPLSHGVHRSVRIEAGDVTMRVLEIDDPAIGGRIGRLDVLFKIDI